MDGVDGWMSERVVGAMGR